MSDRKNWNSEKPALLAEGKHDESNLQSDLNPPKKITREMAIEQHLTCCLCGSELNFKHQVNHLVLKVTEVADCPSCLIKLRERDHGLH